ncbi:MAG TPA: transposase [Candidatus Methylomirabilis sp.]|nr:transposase [Candidatus Methylomirabilis sp.]
MKKSFQFRIYPNRNQEVILNRTLSTCRHLYNDSLAERKKQAELNKLKKEFDVFPWGKPEWISYEDQANDLSGSKTDFQKEVHSQVLQNTLKRLDRSFKNFYNGFGYPRFQGRDRYNTFTYPQSGFSINLKDSICQRSDVSKLSRIEKSKAELRLVPSKRILTSDM